ncbi:MAG: TrkA family potassium uptake protein [Actinomycetes bacterium]|jgi:trk system potassium uptake protein TrkA
MRVAIAGAGKVGRAIARDLVSRGHEVLVIDKETSRSDDDIAPGIELIHADACEIATLERAELARCDVMVAATGDDKANLVVSLLAKTEFGVRRVVARVNHPRNEWLFDESWGVDVAVSTPTMLTALVEEAVSIGELVRLFTFRTGSANLVEFTLAPDSPVVGKRVGDVALPAETALVAIVRDQRVLIPNPDEPLENADELLLVTTIEHEMDLQELLAAATSSNASELPGLD